MNVQLEHTHEMYMLDMNNSLIPKQIIHHDSRSIHILCNVSSEQQRAEELRAE